MLRYFYLLCLLIFINISFCIQYTSNNESRNSQKNKKLRVATNLRHRRLNAEQRRFRKRHDYDMAYDKEPVAQIDVANFIKGSEDESFGENVPYEFPYMRHSKYYNEYENLNEINSNEKLNSNEDYLVINAEHLSENSVNLNDVSKEENKEKYMPGLDNILSLNDDSLTSNIHHQQKKCALKNIKLPFFSHNKSVTAKGKKNKKRKLLSLSKSRKDIISKENNEKLAKKKIDGENQNPYKYYKIDKRSYIERLCPACKKKIIENKHMYSKDKRRYIFKKPTSTIKHNNDESVLEDESKNLNTYKVTADVNNRDPNEEADFEDPWRERRRKREDDNRNIERQKELDDLERRVESVSVNNSAYNKISPKM